MGVPRRGHCRAGRVHVWGREAGDESAPMTSPPPPQGPAPLARCGRARESCRAKRRRPWCVQGPCTSICSAPLRCRRLELLHREAALMALSFLALACSRVCVYIQMQGNALIAIYLSVLLCEEQTLKTRTLQLFRVIFKLPLTKVNPDREKGNSSALL